MSRTADIEAARAVPVSVVADRLGLEPKNGNKYPCVSCSSSDALSIKHDKERAKCFSCGDSWDGIGLVQVVKACTFSQAYRWLNGQDVAFTPSQLFPVATSRGIEVRREIWERLSSNKTQPNPLQGPPDACGLSMAAREYLRGRALHPRDVAFDELGLVSVHIDHWRALPGLFSADDLRAAGLMTRPKKDKPERLHLGWLTGDLILLPYRDDSGELETFRVRSTHPKPDSPKVWSLVGDQPTRPFGWPHAARDGLLYLVEGELDAMSLWDCGRSALGIPGVNGWQDGWSELVEGDVMIIRDDDAAGLSMVTAILQSGVRARSCTLEANDPNDALQAGTLQRELNEIEEAIGWQSSTT